MRTSVNVHIRLTPSIAPLIELRLVKYYTNEISRRGIPFGTAECKFLGVLFTDSILT